MTEAEVKESLALAYEYCHKHDEWVESLASALDGVGIADAQRKPAPEAKCIWEIVLHVAVWNENIVERTRSREKARPSEGAWPPLPEVRDDRAWDSAKTRLTNSLTGIERLLQESTLDELNGGPYGLPDLLCRFFHIAYHLGQIAKMRECFGADPAA